MKNGTTKLGKANRQWEYIIGANDPGDPARKIVTTKYKCLVTLKNKIAQKHLKVLKDITDPADCNCTYFAALNCFATDLQTFTKTVLIVLPNDGAVLEQSAMAFPGCPEKYKHKMINSNHLQMRNDDNTKKMLEILFRAKPDEPYEEIDKFFEVEHR